MSLQASLVMTGTANRTSMLVIDMFTSILFCSGPAGHIKNCAISNVRCKYIDAEDCVLINVTAERIVARPGSILYNLIESQNDESEEGIAAATTTTAEPREVRVGVFREDGGMDVVHSSLDIDGGKDCC